MREKTKQSLLWSCVCDVAFSTARGQRREWKLFRDTAGRMYVGYNLVQWLDITHEKEKESMFMLLTQKHRIRMKSV